MKTNMGGESEQFPFESFYLDGWLVDPGECTLSRTETDEKHKITPRAMSVLAYLAEHAGEVVSTEELLGEIWGNTYIAPNAVQKTISEIRRVLAEDARSPEILLTVPKRGYKVLLSPNEIKRAQSDDGASALRFSVSSFLTWKGYVGAIILLLVFVSLLYTFYPSPAPDREALRLQTFEHPDGNRLGLLIPENSKEVDPLGLMSRSAASIAMSLGYARTSKVRISAAGTLSKVNQTNGLDRVVRLSKVGEGVLLECFPFAGNFEFTRILKSDSAIAAAPLLRTLLNPRDQKRMARWGTRSPEAYQLAREAVVIQRRANLDSMVQAKPLLQKAIVTEPGFVVAYSELGFLLVDISRLSPDLQQAELARDELLDLIDRAEINDISDDILESLRLKLEYLSIDKPIELERRLSLRLEANPDDSEALFDYAGLLAGVGFAEEALAYVKQSTAGMTPAEADRVITLRLGDIWAATDRHKANLHAAAHLKNAPNDPVALIGMVQRLALMDNLSESERFLERLKLSDKDGAWSYAGEVTFKAIRGDYNDHPAKLRTDLENPRMTNMMRGRLYFLLGNVDAGIAAWKQVEPSLRWILWRYPAANELNFPKEVVEHPRFQLFMDDLGVGPRWRAYLRNRVMLLTAVTGIPVSTELPSSDATLLASR